MLTNNKKIRVEICSMTPCSLSYILEGPDEDWRNMMRSNQMNGGQWAVGHFIEISTPDCCQQTLYEKKK